LCTRFLEQLRTRVAASGREREEVIEQRLLDVPQVRELLGGQQVEEVSPHALDVHGRGCLQRGEARVREYR